MSDLRVREWSTLRTFPDGRMERVIHTLGGRYDPNMSAEEVAERVRLLICDAIRCKLLPPMKVSVLLGAGPAVCVCVEECEHPKGSPEADEAVELMSRFVKAYQRAVNYTDSEYCEENFRCEVRWWPGAKWQPVAPPGVLE